MISFKICPPLLRWLCRRVFQGRECHDLRSSLYLMCSTNCPRFWWMHFVMHLPSCVSIKKFKISKCCPVFWCHFQFAKFEVFFVKINRTWGFIFTTKLSITGKIVSLFSNRVLWTFCEYWVSVYCDKCLSLTWGWTRLMHDNMTRW